MKRWFFLAVEIVTLSICVISTDASAQTGHGDVSGPRPGARAPGTAVAHRVPDALTCARAREQEDTAAMNLYRPAYLFWRHVFTVPDGAIVFGSARDGRLLASFPTHGDWTSGASWGEPSLRSILADQELPGDLSQRREVVAQLFSTAVGPVVQNASRGLFVAPNVRRYGGFLDEWGAIYERFAVPRGIGLAQALVESGFSGRVRSEARALGFCQWLEGNWRRLQRLAPYPIEAENQTTQAAYCAAYLTVLATKYRSFIPALSEHHAGGTNVGRILINGERLGGDTVTARYFLGSDFARDLRRAAPGLFSDVYGTYGPRSYLYAEMIFGNIPTVASITARVPQTPVFAVRVSRAVSLAALVRHTGLSAVEIQRYNPALTARVPARAVVYLPKPTSGLGTDVSFWRRRPPAPYSAAMNEFAALDVTLDDWDDSAFDAVLRRFRQQFATTGSEEGAIMATILAYVLEERTTNRGREILNDFRVSARIRDRFNEAQFQRTLVRETGDSTAGHGE